MLRLKNITKDYEVADSKVPALKGISLSFRKNEFVSILGPSGCGKTTTLNIIGGLDKYTDGDLFIGGVSTKSFKDHDWDVYRNHRIGFIFQSYNLIPHQTILGNVALSLTIAGVNKKERNERAKRALDRVGLQGQYNKKPNQLSGGQCQRVAIARALVNEPDILLADEPTGALDTVTSIQIMDLIKEISKEKLVIMVTHNPDLAEKYSTRIVRLLDGELQSDTNPFSEEDEIKECEEIKKEQEAKPIDYSTKEKKEKAQMSFFTAFRLSARNLHSKRKRTTMVAFAGCIGIVGVSLVLAVSQGVRGYISNMQNDMLSGNPVSITSSSINYSSILEGNLSSSSTTNPNNNTDAAYVNQMASMLASMGGVTSTNVISKEYMDFLNKMPKENTSYIKYNYGDKIVPNLYTDFVTPYKKVNMSISGIKATYQSLLSNVKEYKSFASMISSVTELKEMPSDADYIATQYDIVYKDSNMTLKEIIEDKSSLIAVVSQSSNTLNDFELAEYGYFTQQQFLNYCYKIGGSDLYDESSPSVPEKISYDDISKKTFTWYPNDSVFYQVSGKETDGDYGPKWYAKAYSDGALKDQEGEEYEDYTYDAIGDVDGKLDLNVKCILKLKSDLSYGCLTAGGLYYTNALTTHMRSYNQDSTIVDSAASNDDTLYNIELGYKFKFDDKATTKASCEHVSLSSSTNSAILTFLAQYIGGSSSSTKTVSSYSKAALGGAEYPQSVYFYCDNFEQKQLLTDYLDKWNTNSSGNLYKLSDDGFYQRKVKDETTGKDTIEYYYKDYDGTYRLVKMDSDGFITDADGQRYKYFNDTQKKDGFYLYKGENEGKAFTIDEAIDLSDGSSSTGNFTSISAYNLLSYTLFKDEFTKGNIYWGKEKQVEGYTNLYSYVNADEETKYLLRTQNKSFYSVDLDENGEVVAKNDNYNKYEYGSNIPEPIRTQKSIETDRFYYIEYVSDGAGKYDKSYTPVARDEDEKDKWKPSEHGGKACASATQDKLYSSDTVVQYANAVKNPTFTINGDEYTLDTHNFYIDLTDASNIDLNDVTIDTTNKRITINDYSKFSFYYKLDGEEEYSYHYVDVTIEGNKYYLNGTSLSSYLDNYDIPSSVSEKYLSEKYLYNPDGTFQAMTKVYGDECIGQSVLVEKGILSTTLDDPSTLMIDEGKKITYTDSIGLIVGMVNNLIDIVTYALVAFTALSLVVSTVMIGIITYVSVVERTKEIGVIRAMGGRKRDVANLFIAETFIIGLASGVIGIAITYVLSAIINVVVGKMTSVYTIASLPFWMALIMIALSIFLTMVSGLVPSRSAARQDPVNALRSE